MKKYWIFLFMLTFSALAHGASETTAEAQSPIPFFIMVVVFVLFLYFTAWRPQSKRAKEHQNLLQSLTKGDEVLTNGGMLGKVVKITDQFVLLTVANDVEVMLQKNAISMLLPKGTMKSLN